MIDFKSLFICICLVIIPVLSIVFSVLFSQKQFLKNKKEENIDNKENQNSPPNLYIDGISFNRKEKKLYWKQNDIIIELQINNIYELN